MTRSEINKLQQEAVAFFDRHQFRLPPWAFWHHADWQQQRMRAAEVISARLGWDLTDFGLGTFFRTGLLLFTIRNGRLGEPNGKSYAEKIMIVREEQVTPWHFHWHKMEDIINRGGGNLIVALCHSGKEEEMVDKPVSIQIDGMTKTVAAKESVRLQPGESVTLPPLLYHQFYGEAGSGTVLVGEVSSVNDDQNDNRFFEPVGRFPKIEEDEPALYPLCHEYVGSR